MKLIRISQEDVFNDTIDWETQIIEAIKKLTETDLKIVYIASNEELYDMHKKQITNK